MSFFLFSVSWQFKFRQSNPEVRYAGKPYWRMREKGPEKGLYTHIYCVVPWIKQSWLKYKALRNEYFSVMKLLTRAGWILCMNLLACVQSSTIFQDCDNKLIIGATRERRCTEQQLPSGDAEDGFRATETRRESFGNLRHIVGTCRKLITSSGIQFFVYEQRIKF